MFSKNTPFSVFHFDRIWTNIGEVNSHTMNPQNPQPAQYLQSKGVDAKKYAMILNQLLVRLKKKKVLSSDEIRAAFGH